MELEPAVEVLGSSRHSSGHSRKPRILSSSSQDKGDTLHVLKLHLMSQVENGGAAPSQLLPVLFH